MAKTPESFMIYREELRKAQVENKRLKDEYDKVITELSSEMGVLKERIESQEDMLRRVVNYASKLEDTLDTLEKKVQSDIFRNNNGFH